MSDLSKAETDLLGPIAQSIQPLFDAILANYIPRAIATGVDPQLAIGFLTIGLNAQLASLLAVERGLDAETIISLKDSFYEIGFSTQITIAQSVADIILELNRKLFEGN